MTSLFDGFYQMGFVARDLDQAIATFGRVHGVTRFRRKQASAVMESAHAWIGNTMVELIAITPGVPSIYQDHLPKNPGEVRLHHHGFRVADEIAWDDINHRVAAAGLATPMKGSVMEGQLQYLYVDTRALTGLYSEFVYLTGTATSLYDDVPRN